MLSRRYSRLRRYGLLILTAAVAMTGCSGSGDSSSGGSVGGKRAATGSDAAGAHPKLTAAGVGPAKSDELLLFYGDDPDTLNLLVANDNVSTAFQRYVYESLADRDMANPRKWIPRLAESWEFDEKNLEYTIHLRRGVMWHPMTLPNGTALPRKEFTANDVTFTFACILNEHVEAASLRSYYVDPDAKDPSERYKIKVAKVDKYTVKIRWTKPYFMADDFTLGAAVLPRHVYSVDEKGEPISFDFSSKEFADGFNNHWANTRMCGTGPLIFKEWKKGERTTLVRNPDYWGPPFYFDKVVYRFQSNMNTARQQLLQGELDWASIPEKDQYFQTKDHPSVTSGKVVLKEFRRTAYRYLGYNLRRAVFKDRKVRMALSHAVPVDSIIQNVFHGLAVRTTGPFVPGGAFYDSSLPPIPFDLDKARSLLDEAGWKDTDNDGVRDKVIDGKKVPMDFVLMIFSDSQTYLAIAEIIKENFRKIGVSVQIEPAKWALMLQKLRKKEFDATILGWVADWKSDPFQIWHGSQADVPESSNSIGYQNVEVDRLIEKLRVTMKEEDQIELYHKIHRLLYEDQPYTFLFAEKATVGYNARLQNIKFYPMLRPHVDLREWYASSPRR